MNYFFVVITMLFSMSVSAEETYIKLTSYYDLENDNYDLEEPKEFKITENFVNKYYVDFRVFKNDDEYPSVCFVGNANEALQIVQSILDVSTGDSFILESSLNVKGNAIVHDGTYTEGSGDYDFDLSFEVPRCEGE